MRGYCVNINSFEGDVGKFGEVINVQFCVLDMFVGNESFIITSG